jgi:hypothetical protein
MGVRKTKPPIIKPPKNSGNPSDLGAKKAATSATMLEARHQMNHSLAGRPRNKTSNGIRSANDSATHPLRHIQSRHREPFPFRSKAARLAHDIPTNRKGIQTSARNAPDRIAAGNLCPGFQNERSNTIMRGQAIQSQRVLSPDAFSISMFTTTSESVAPISVGRGREGCASVIVVMSAKRTASTPVTKVQ